MKERKSLAFSGAYPGAYPGAQPAQQHKHSAHNAQFSKKMNADKRL
jgi:hypothetical protein